MSLSLIAALLAAGCGLAGSDKVQIKRFPAWEFQKYERVAVTPFGAFDRRAAQAAQRLEDRLTHLLTKNGAFTVLSRSDLKGVFTEQDLSQLADAADPSTVISQGKIKAAQAIVVGKITEYELIRERVEKHVPRLALDRRGMVIRDSVGRTKLLRMETVPYVRHAVRVAAAVRVINAATGEILFSHATKPIEREVLQEGGPPSVAPEELASDAIDRLAAEVYAQLAPVNLTVELDSDMLIVATGYFDGQYDKKSKLSALLDKFIVAVCKLPPECDRNPFRIGISLKDGHENIVEREFVWDDGLGAKGVVIEIPMSDLTAHMNGKKTDFVAKLYSGAEAKPILERKFRVESGG